MPLLITAEELIFLRLVVEIDAHAGVDIKGFACLGTAI